MLPGYAEEGRRVISIRIFLGFAFDGNTIIRYSGIFRQASHFLLDFCTKRNEKRYSWNMFILKLVQDTPWPTSYFKS